MGATGRVNGSLMMLVIMLTLTGSDGLSHSCPPMTHSVLVELLPQFHPLSDGQSLEMFQLEDFNVTCLSLSNIKDQYRFITVSVSYIIISTQNRTVTALIDIGCQDNTWDPTVLGAEVSFKYISQPVDTLRMDCSMCISDTHPWKINNASDPYTHCIGCHSDCSIAGTLCGCTGPLKTDCCLVYHSNGTCSDKVVCQEGEIINETDYTCITNTKGENNSSSASEVSLTAEETTQEIDNNLNWSNSQSILSSVTPSSLATTLPNESNINLELIQLSVFTSFITTLITFALTFTFTALMVTFCLCTCWKFNIKQTTKKVAQQEGAVNTVYNSSFTNTTEYIEPSTSPLVQTDRSRSTDNISMNFNPAYYRIRYLGRPVVGPAVIYEDVDGPVNNEQVVGNTLCNNNERSTINSNSSNSYITILP